jgi:hypothetical protein
MVREDLGNEELKDKEIKILRDGVKIRWEADKEVV